MVIGEKPYPYLIDRRRYTSWNGTKFTTQNNDKVVSGIAFGTNLFLLYLDDLDKCIGDSQKAKFAGDTTIIKCKKNAFPLIDIDRRNMSKWFVDNKLTVNRES